MRQQPWTLAASLNPRIADSDPLLVGGTSNRVVDSHTWNQNVVHASTVSKCSDGVNATYPSDSATPLVTSTALPA